MTSAEHVEDVRLAIYDGFRRTGQAPSVQSLASALGLAPDAVADAMRALHQHRDIVLDQDANIAMAHPFASIPLGFSVMGERTLWWGGCAWDSFAIAHLVPEERSVLVATTCPGCGRALSWVVTADEAPAGDEVAHFLTPVARIWDDVIHSCAHQRLFCSRECVAAWLAPTGNEPGYVMDLGTLWRLARGWYAGRLERGYARREPAAAAAYFAEARIVAECGGLENRCWVIPNRGFESHALRQNETGRHTCWCDAP
jgi:hypothetical protein